jgi:hypothetical protein
MGKSNDLAQTHTQSLNVSLSPSRPLRDLSRSRESIAPTDTHAATPTASADVSNPLSLAPLLTLRLKSPLLYACSHHQIR